MIIKVRLFAVARQLAGTDSLDVDMAPGSTLGQLREQLAKQTPALEAVLGQVLFAVGTEYAQDATLLREGDEVACIPPVSGG